MKLGGGGGGGAIILLLFYTGLERVKIKDKVPE